MMGDRSSIHGCRVLPFLILFTIKFSHSADTLLPNQSIKDGETLVSANRTFALGFFSPSGSLNRYVGVWYHKLPVQTVVWVGNRGLPVFDTSGYLTIDGKGNLIILDSIGRSITIASNSGATNLTAATLTDTGNLVLKEWSDGREGQALWQSFDNPTDTLIPGMRMGMHGKQNRFLTSWTSSEDPAQGDFSVGIDPNGTKQFIIWRKGQVYWKSGVWTGKNFSSVPEMTPTYYIYFSYMPTWNGDFYSYSLNDSSKPTRTVMDFSGQIKQVAWVETSQEWVQFWAGPTNYSCEIPTSCGANGLCNNYTTPTCNCLDGFEPKSDLAWNSGNWAGGCVRREMLECGNGDGFLQLKGVKLPIFFLDTGVSSIGIEDCKAKCAPNCSCTAYASAHENGTGCLLWFGDLLGLQAHHVATQDLYVRLAASELNPAADNGRKQKLWIAIIMPVSVVIILLLGVFLYCWHRKKLQLKAKQELSQELQLLGTDNIAAASHKLSEGPIDGEGEKVPDCPLFSFSTLLAATNNFSASNKLGEGGFGPVYKGMLEGHELAVKRLSRSSGQGVVEFRNEISLIANLQHRNLVRLLGYCIQGEEKLLIYEYMPNKSLDIYIFDPIKGAELDWKKRLDIIEGIAQGLLYLHKYSRLRVIHRDMKASNILLDGEMNPKISDFGTARIFERNESQANTNRVVGTYGYMSPEYAMEGLFSEKSDVFSFGVLLLEILSGKKNRNLHWQNQSLNLLGYAWELWKEGNILELMDPLLGDLCHLEGYSRCIQVALLCVQDVPEDRPTMSEVVSLLSNESISPKSPKKPIFSFGRTMEIVCLPSSTREECTANDITVSAMEGR
ncbi:G-type lectin S-receptor-like serine/threonine-protein kinase At4g27290 [Phoenix dactylifera]|uniref:Receptor-like serine/threonine-protein kinase n=1 Tax=Phoenix dactylifera TaxID=42345 RepID=A0A8B7MSH1_PHODC|nr:G-type lectin S-receptor-like serine/threonine-protein kinase At4g27290 [Phoenix dactylifera]